MASQARLLALHAYIQAGESLLCCPSRTAEVKVQCPKLHADLGIPARTSVDWPHLPLRGQHLLHTAALHCPAHLVAEQQHGHQCSAEQYLESSVKQQGSNTGKANAASMACRGAARHHDG